MDKGGISWPEPFIFGMVTIEFLDTGDKTRMLILLNIYVYTCYSILVIVSIHKHTNHQHQEKFKFIIINTYYKKYITIYNQIVLW